MYYFALFAILISILANPSAQLHRGGPRSRLPIRRTSETCEPVYEEDHHRAYREAGDIDNSLYRNRGKKHDNSYDYDQDSSEEDQRESVLEKGSSTKIGGRSKLRGPKITFNVGQIGKPISGEIIVKQKGRKSDYNVNTNVNRLDVRENRIVMKHVLEESKKNDDEVDDDDDVASVRRQMNQGQSPNREDPSSSPGAKHNPPPYAGSSRGRSLNVKSDLNQNGHLNVNTNVNRLDARQKKIVVKNVLEDGKKKDDKVDDDDDSNSIKPPSTISEDENKDGDDVASVRRQMNQGQSPNREDPSASPGAKHNPPPYAGSSRGRSLNENSDLNKHDHLNVNTNVNSLDAGQNRIVVKNVLKEGKKKDDKVDDDDDSNSIKPPSTISEDENKDGDDVASVRRQMNQGQSPNREDPSSSPGAKHNPPPYAGSSRGRSLNVKSDLNNHDHLNVNTNVNRLDARQKKIVVKNVLEEGKKKDDEVDADDDSNSIKPVSTISEDENKRGDDVASVRRQMNQGQSPNREDPSSSPGAKHNPPPYAGSSRGRSLNENSDLNKHDHLNVNTNVNRLDARQKKIVVKNVLEERKKKDDKVDDDDDSNSIKPPSTISEDENKDGDDVASVRRQMNQGQSPNREDPSSSPGAKHNPPPYAGSSRGRSLNENSDLNQNDHLNVNTNVNSLDARQNRIVVKNVLKEGKKKDDKVDDDDDSNSIKPPSTISEDENKDGDDVASVRRQMNQGQSPNREDPSSSPGAKHNPPPYAGTSRGRSLNAKSGLNQNDRYNVNTNVNSLDYRENRIVKKNGIKPVSTISEDENKDDDDVASVRRQMNQGQSPNREDPSSSPGAKHNPPPYAGSSRGRSLNENSDLNKHDHLNVNTNVNRLDARQKKIVVKNVLEEGKKKDDEVDDDDDSNSIKPVSTISEDENKDGDDVASVRRQMNQGQSPNREDPSSSPGAKHNPPPYAGSSRGRSLNENSDLNKHDHLNVNTNVNSLDARQNRIVVKNVLKEGTKKDDKVDDDEDSNSIKPVSTISEDENKDDDDVASVRRQMNQGQSPNREDPSSSPGAKHNPPPYAGSSRGRSLNENSDLNNHDHLNVNTNVNSLDAGQNRIVVKNVLKKGKKKDDKVDDDDDSNSIKPVSTISEDENKDDDDVASVRRQMNQGQSPNREDPSSSPGAKHNPPPYAGSSRGRSLNENSDLNKHDHLNVNTNVNSLDAGQNRIVVKNVLKEGKKKDDKVDDDDDSNSIKPPSTISEDENKDGDDVASVRRQMNQGQSPNREDPSSSPGAKHNPPPYAGSSRGRSLNVKSDLNINTNVNELNIERTEGTIDDEKDWSQVNSQNDQPNSHLSEKNTSVQIDTAVISEDEDLEKIEDASPTPEPQISSTSKLTEIIRPAINSVTGTPELSGSYNDAGSKNKRAMKYRKIFPKSHGKKKRKIHHKRRDPESEISEQEKNSREQQIEGATESNVESTTSVVENIPESTVEEIETENKLDLNGSILKLFNVDSGTEISSHKAQLLNKVLDQMTDDEKKTILRDLQEKTAKKVEMSQNGDSKIEGETPGDDESTPIDALLTTTPSGAVPNSDGEAENVETKNDSSSADETVNSDNKTSESESSDVEPENKEQEIQMNTPASTNDEIEGNENGSNETHVDEAETLDDPTKTTVVDRPNDDDHGNKSEETSSIANGDDHGNKSEETSSIANGDDHGNKSEETSSIANDDDHGNKSEETSSIANDVQLNIKSHEKNRHRVVNIPKVVKTSKNVNSNVNRLTVELRASQTQPHRADDAIFGTNRRSIGRLPRRNNANINKNVNNHVKDIEESDEEESERRASKRRSLDRELLNDINSNEKKNVNANSNVNRNVVDTSDDQNVRDHRQRGNKVKLSKKTVDSIIHEVGDLQKTDKKLENRRSFLHKRFDDSAYLQQ